MLKNVFCYFIASLSLYSIATFATVQTIRIPQFSNNKVTVWKTIIYPEKAQRLSLHRHERDRVLIALTDGVLKVTSNQGAVHELKLQKDQAYYLSKDPIAQLHTDENMSHHPIKVMVVELKN